MNLSLKLFLLVQLSDHNRNARKLELTSGNLFGNTKILHEYSFSFPIHTAYFCNIFQNRQGTLKVSLPTMERKFIVQVVVTGENLFNISSDLLVFLRITKVCCKMGIWTLIKIPQCKNSICFIAVRLQV